MSANPGLAAPLLLGPDGWLRVEELPLAELVVALEGRPAWVLSDRALERALTLAGEAQTLEVGAVGPPEILARVAARGFWACARSSHELGLALAAGFDPQRLVAAGPVRDDGFLKDALSAGVAVVPVDGPGDAENVARMARLLALDPPAREGAPPAAPPDLLSQVGGLLAAVLVAPPQLALDVALPTGAAPGASLYALLPGPVQEVGLCGLSRWGGEAPLPARLHGVAARGDWLFLPRADAALPRAADPVHAMPVSVMVRGGLWTELAPRPWPAA